MKRPARKAAAQRALARLEKALALPLGPRETGLAIAGTCRALFAHDAFFLDLYDPAKGTSLTVYAEDTPSGGRRPEETRISSTTLSPLTADLARSGEAMLINRLSDPTNAPLKTFGQTDRRSRSWMLVPIRSGDRVIALLSAQSYTPCRYTDVDVALLQAVASRSARAVERLRP